MTVGHLEPKLITGREVMNTLQNHVLQCALIIAAASFLSGVAAMARDPRVDDFRPPTSEELTMQSVAFAPGASAVILDWVNRRDDIDRKVSTYVRIKILTAEGKKYADVELPPFDPRDTDFSKLEARTIKPDGTIVPFTGKTYEKLIIRTGGLRIISRTFSLPDVQPGSIIEFRYQLDFRGVVPEAKLILQHELPILRETVWIRPLSYAASVRYRNLGPDVHPLSAKDHYELTLNNLPAFEKEPFSLPDGELEAILYFFYTGEKFDSSAFWAKEANTWNRIVEDFISGDVAPIHKAAQEAIAGAVTPEEKLRKIYAVIERIRNLDYENEKTEAEERRLRDNYSAQDVLRNGYGHSSQINRLFIALGRSAGFEANAVRIGSRESGFFTKTLPYGLQLDSEVAVVKLDGKEVFLDPGTPRAPFGIVAWQKTDVPGVKLAKREHPTWIDSPRLKPANALSTRKAVLRVDGDMIKGEVTATYNGEEALVRRLYNYNDDDDATKKSMEKAIKSHLPDGTNVKLTSLTGMTNADPAVVSEYHVDLTNAASFVGSRILIPLSLFHFTGSNPFAATERKSGVYFKYPSIEEEDVTLELPADYSVESMPAPTDLDAGAFVFRAQHENVDGKIHFTRRLLENATIVPIEKYQALRTIFSKIAASDQEQVVLRKSAVKAAK